LYESPHGTGDALAGFGSGLVAIAPLALLLPLPVAVPIIVLLDYIASASHGLNNPGCD
jgi:hypothetical protein